MYWIGFVAFFHLPRVRRFILCIFLNVLFRLHCPAIYKEEYFFLSDFQVLSLKEWQNKVNDHLWSVEKPLYSTQDCSSDVLEEHTDCAASVPAKVNRKASSVIPDSGFQSINIEHDVHTEFCSSERSSAEGSVNTEQCLDTVRHCKQEDSLCLEDKAAAVEVQSESSKDTSNNEQDSSLLQRYLDKVEQLEQSDSSSHSDMTEESRLEISNSSLKADFHFSGISNAYEDGESDILQIPNDTFQSSDESESLQKPSNIYIHVPQGDLTP